ncbi:MAG: DNA polymerase III subunit delta' [Methylococcales bacterium]|nr:DNA polymerase III subunit delta' [Methylococcales bacterium]
MSIYPWQQKIWARLCSYRAQERIPQALLIIGNKGVGKVHLAHQFAYSLLCTKLNSDGLGCGHCNSCLLLDAKTHPDFIQVTSEEPGKSITIGQIRGLVTRLTLKPQYESFRVVMVYPADAMNNAAANAFLKCLEEPTGRTVILLITDSLSRIPATIVSRCQQLSIANPDKETASAWLSQQLGNADTGALLALAQGSPLLACDYMREGVLDLRNDCFKAWMAIAKQQVHPLAVAEDWNKLPESSLIIWMTTWVVDLIKCSFQLKDNSLYNQDLHKQLAPLSEQLEIKGLYLLYDLLLQSRRLFNTQINKHTMFEEILIKWQELNLSK